MLVSWENNNVFLEAPLIIHKFKKYLYKERGSIGICQGEKRAKQEMRKMWLMEKQQQEEAWRWSESRSVVSDCLRPHGLYSPVNSPGQNTGVGSLSLLQGIVPTQGSNPGLPHCRRIVHQLSHGGRRGIVRSSWESVSLPSFLLSDNFSFQLCLSDCCIIYQIYFLGFHIS